MKPTVHARSSRTPALSSGFLKETAAPREEPKATPRNSRSSDLQTREILSEGMFRKVLRWERKRAERYQKSFLLMLLDASQPLLRDQSERTLPAILAALSRSTKCTRGKRKGGLSLAGLPGDGSSHVLAGCSAKLMAVMMTPLAMVQTFTTCNQDSIRLYINQGHLLGIRKTPGKHPWPSGLLSSVSFFVAFRRAKETIRQSGTPPPTEVRVDLD